jgi:hypothetical protein
MIGFAFSFDFAMPGSVPPAALTMIDEVVFNGMQVTANDSPQQSVMLYIAPALNTGCHDEDAPAWTDVLPSHAINKKAGFLKAGLIYLYRSRAVLPTAREISV